MARILVTGAQGLLGSTLVPHLRARGYNLIEHVRSSPGDSRADLTDVHQVYLALDKAMPDVIVNLAALTDVDECERSPQRAYQLNVKIVENIAKWIQGSGNNCHLIQLSTDQVYDGSGPHKEDELALSNYYGFSKFAGELVASTVSSTVLRTNFFGPSRCPGRISLSDWLVDALINKRAITVFDDVRFSPLSLQYLVTMIELVIERRQQGIFNLGSKGGMSKAEFAFALAEVLGLPTGQITIGTSENVKLATYRPKNMCMNSSRFEETFGVKLPILKKEIQSMKVAYAIQAR